MNNLDTVRWGIIGCGDVTEIKSGPGFRKAIGSKLIAVMRRDGNLAKDYALRHSVPRWYDNASSLINDEEVNAVYVATPPSTHKKYVLEAATAGKPVYVEKPMAVSYTECVQMVEACKAAGVSLFTAYYRRALPYFLKIKELIDDGEIGIIRSINVQFNQTPSSKDLQRETNWRVDPSTAGCGYFCDLGSHMIDFLLFLFGQIKTVTGISANVNGLYKAEDIVSALFEFENGIHGIGNWCFCASENLDRTEISGTKGKIIYSTFNSSVIIIQRGTSSENVEVAAPEHVQQPLIQQVVDELLGKSKCSITGESGMETSRVMDIILGRLVG